ncbi:MAG TPA: His/Gly/Thr/Pro-type tRNA ligase C-terminal domain-containing protein, partial [Actinomycetota bacterium]|nr:His/Gly/Thr/Pro-type tRNA ligase C-terminal domain-containing protein [Actinomycetota bacterium]
DVPASRVLKCLVYRVGERLVAVLVPGDRDVNEGKLRRLFAPEDVAMLDDFDGAGLVRGFVGPQGLEDVEIVADHHVREGVNWVAGANRVDAHATGVNVDRDFRVDRWEDVSGVHEGDTCPRCERGTLRMGRSIEVGHTFQLGTKYSEPLKAMFLDEDGLEKPFVMGCYGIGVSRIVASVVEQHNDEHGIVWPKAVAPFDAVVISTNMDDAGVVEAAEQTFTELRDGGLEVVLDDRDARAGVKFADADLIGYPVQVVVGKKGLDRGMLELKLRATGDRSDAPFDRAVAAVRDLQTAAP